MHRETTRVTAATPALRALPSFLQGGSLLLILPVVIVLRVEAGGF
jgi:hypothetical protein